MAQDVSVGIGADNSTLLRAIEESKTAVTAFFETVTEEGAGVSAMLEEMQGKFSAAFQFTGVTVAIEAVHKLAETIEEMGSRAAEMRTTSDVIGITVEQFQAMQVAAEEAGVSTETLTHAAEHFVTILSEARDGSSAAIEKLLSLGVTTEQINDPLFKLNDLFQVLHDRLTNPVTAAATMTALLVVLGARAGLAAEALKLFDGSAESVAKAMERVNGLNAEQAKQLQESSAWWRQLGTWISNAYAKQVAYSEAAKAGDPANMIKGITGNTPPPLPSDSGVLEGALAQAQDQADQIVQIAKGMVNEQIVLDHSALEQQLENTKLGVAATKEGSAERVSALRDELRVAEELYGSDQVDKVKAINLQLTAAQRAYADEQQRIVDRYSTAYAEALQDIESKSRAMQSRDLSAITQTAAAELDVERDKAIGEVAVQEQALQEQLRSGQVTASQFLAQETELIAQRLAAQERFYTAKKALEAGDVVQSAKIDAEMVKAESDANKQRLAALTTAQNAVGQQWKTLIHGMGSALTSSLAGMIEGTRSFADAFRSLIDAAITGVIEMFVQMGEKWATNLLEQKLLQQTTNSAGVLGNASLAASAAMASVAAIPIYGWAMAPGVGAQTFAEALAYLPSASAGFDIPSGVNPLTQLHQNEMVLPANLANPIREMAKGGARTIVLQAQRGTTSSTISHDQFAQLARECGHKFKLNFS